MSADLGPGRRYRDRSLLESVADALPAGGVFGKLRATARPLFRQLLERRGGAMRSVLPGGETVLVSPAFRHITWNPEEYAAFRAAIRPGATVLDVGANAGAYSVLFAQWAGAAGHVYAFEPDPAAFAGLAAHVVLNGVTDRVTPLQTAITDGISPSVRLATAGSSGISSVVTAATPGADTIDVRATSIDAFCRERGVVPDAIKIDVEGAELLALRGAREVIAARGASLALFVEMHPAIWRSSGIAVDDVRGQCESLGLHAEQLDGSTHDLWSTEGVCLRLRARGA